MPWHVVHYSQQKWPQVLDNCEKSHFTSPNIGFGLQMGAYVSETALAGRCLRLRGHSSGVLEAISCHHLAMNLKKRFFSLWKHSKPFETDSQQESVVAVAGPSFRSA